MVFNLFFKLCWETTSERNDQPLNLNRNISIDSHIESADVQMLVMFQLLKLIYGSDVYKNKHVWFLMKPFDSLFLHLSFFPFKIHSVSCFGLVSFPLWAVLVIPEPVWPCLNSCELSGTCTVSLEKNKSAGLWWAGHLSSCYPHSTLATETLYPNVPYLQQTQEAL